MNERQIARRIERLARQIEAGPDAFRAVKDILMRETAMRNKEDLIADLGSEYGSEEVLVAIQDARDYLAKIDGVLASQEKQYRIRAKNAR